MTDETRRKTLARLQVFAAGVLFSTGGAAIKATALDGFQVAGMRAGIGALFLWLAVPAARRGWSRRTVPVSLAYGATLLLFVLANKLTTAANTIFLQSSSPLYLLLLAPFLLRERIRRREVVMLALIAVGMALFFWGLEPPQATAPAPGRGNSLAAVAGLAWALTVIGLRWLSRGGGDRSSGSLPAVVLGNVFIVFVCLPRISGISELTLKDAFVLGFLGVVQVGVAYVLLTRGMRHVPALEASLLLMAEPVLSPVWAWLLHGETIGPWPLVGGTLILAATALPALYEASRRSRTALP